MTEELEIDVRVAKPQDARAILGLCEQVGSETPYLTFGEEGLNLTVQEEVAIINKYNKAQNSILLVSEADDQIIGMSNITQFNAAKQRHIAEIGICLVEEYWGYGIASMMMEMMIEFAENSDVKVITLEVAQRNEAAIKLYEKFGFEIVGNLRKRLKVEGCYLDSFVMEKVLD